MYKQKIHEIMAQNKHKNKCIGRSPRASDSHRDFQHVVNREWASSSTETPDRFRCASSQGVLRAEFPNPNGLPAKCAFQLCFPLCLKLSISYSLPVLLVRCLFRRLSMSVGRFLVSRSYCSVLDFRSPVLSVANTRWPSTLVMSIRFE